MLDFVIINNITNTIICTDVANTGLYVVGGSSRIKKASPEEFIHIFVSNSERLTEFLEHMVRVQPFSTSLVYNTLLELNLHDYVHEKEISVSQVI